MTPLALIEAISRYKALESTRRERARILAMALQIIDTEHDGSRPTVREVMRAVQDYYGITTVEMQSGQKPGRITHARQVVMYLAKQYTGATNREIGIPMGGRDPSTCYHAVMTIKRKLAAGDDRLAAEIADIKAALVPCVEPNAREG